MHDPAMERGTLAARHDFDMLPRSAEIDVQPAQPSELSALADMANRLVPGVRITEPDLERYFTFDPESILTFSRKKKLLGAVAFLYLNSRGHDALILDEVNLTHPDVRLLAGHSEEVSAIYVWAIAGQGRAMAGLGNVSKHLSAPRLACADLYLAEQDCPIEEEFDGNDLVAAHFIGFVGTEPAGCLRVRFFGEFAKVERLAVRHQYRRSRVSFKLVQASVDYIKRKGFRKIYGQAQDRLVDFWAHFGAKPLGHNRKITFSDFSYTEMVLDIEPAPDAITLDSDPYVIIRPEGDWDRPGVLDISSGRAVTSPLRTQ